MSKFHEGENIFVNEVVLKVVDIEKSVEFYRSIMGFKILNRKEKEVELTVDGISPIITILQPDNIVPKLPRRTGIYHFALLLPSRFQLGLFLKHIRDSKYPITGGSNHGVSEAIYLEDPDNNGIEIYADTDIGLWKSNDNTLNMVTEPLDYNNLIEETEGEKWNGMPRETIIGHIHLHVGDLDKARRFYCDGLGFDVVMEMGKSALFISSGRYHHHIGLNIWNGKDALPLPETSAGMKYYTLVFPDMDTRENKINNLKDLGYEVIKEDNNTFTKDPSNNIIRLAV